MIYRREIDGLRAVAVLPVMLFHAGLGLVPGGYLGVDVFFVISGYLITSLILAELAEDRFTLANFWERRARRILPLLMCVVLACLLPAWALLPAQDAEDFAQSLAAIGLSLSNVLFWREGTYFGPAGELKPLLNTWSLAVEEQFYLLYPLACLLITRLGRKGFAFGALLALLASFATAQWLFARDAYAAYFLLPARAWELLLGTLCALALQRTTCRAPRGLQDLAAAVGLALIGGAFFLPGMEYEAGGPSVLAVVAGTVLVILFAGPVTLTGRLLGTRLLVGIGLISYGAYLWHFPLLSFARHVLALSANPEIERIIVLPVWVALLLCLVSLGLAALSWRLIEQPFRNRQKMSLWRTVLLLGGGWAVIAAVGLVMLTTDWQQRFYLTTIRGGDPATVASLLTVRRQSDASLFDPPTLDDGVCIFSAERVDGFDPGRLADCRERFGPGLLLVGDSHAQDLHNVIVRLAAERAFVVTLAKPGCRIADGACFYPNLSAAFRNDLGQAVGRVAYTQAGSALIVDGQSLPDSQQAFIDPDAAQIDIPGLNSTTTLLADLSQRTGLQVALLGSFYEPRINIENSQPLRDGWVPRPSVREQFVQLDELTRASAHQAGLVYYSLMVGELAPQDRILDDGCLIYGDLDHFAPCGEWRMAARLRQSGHPLLELIMPAPLPPAPAPAAAAAR